jgi:serine/threonine protein kinase
MKKMCLLCKRTTPDNNLFCQEAYCPSEMSPYILEQGEWLGDIEIVRVVAILRTSALYVARQGKRDILLKVAYPGASHTERLKREADYLRAVTAKSAHPLLPKLLPPYANTSVAKEAYGRTQFGEHLLYFCVFEAFEGDTLRDVLIKNPQLWVYHVGWVMTALSTAVAVLQSHNLYHYGLSPESVLVRFSEETGAPQLLLFDLGIASDGNGLAASWYPQLVEPAYTAPELITARARPNYATDVYGLGLILYEMLIGQPAYSFKLKGDNDVYTAVRSNQHARMNRLEDVKDVAVLASNAVDSDPAKRPGNAAELANTLLAIFGPAPAFKRRRLPSARTSLMVAAVVLLLAFTITVAINISSIFLSAPAV